MEIDDDTDDAERAIPDVAISSAIRSARRGVDASGAGALEEFTAADAALRASARSLLEDPTHVSMEINIAILEVVLYLTYDVALAHHLVLAVRALDLQVRPAPLGACNDAPTWQRLHFLLTRQTAYALITL